MKIQVGNEIRLEPGEKVNILLPEKMCADMSPFSARGFHTQIVLGTVFHRIPPSKARVTKAIHEFIHEQNTVDELAINLTQFVYRFGKTPSAELKELIDNFVKKCGLTANFGDVKQLVNVLAIDFNSYELDTSIYVGNYMIDSFSQPLRTNPLSQKSWYVCCHQNKHAEIQMHFYADNLNHMAMKNIDIIDYSMA